MTISSVTFRSFSDSGASGSSTIAGLQAKLQNLENDLKSENASKTDDAKTKAEKIKEIDAEIQQVQTEIQQEQAKAAKKKGQTNEAASPGDTDTKAATAKPKRFSYASLDEVA